MCLWSWHFSKCIRQMGSSVWAVACHDFGMACATPHLRATHTLKEDKSHGWMNNSQSACVNWTPHNLHVLWHVSNLSKKRLSPVTFTIWWSIEVFYSFLLFQTWKSKKLQCSIKFERIKNFKTLRHNSRDTAPKYI